MPDEPELPEDFDYTPRPAGEVDPERLRVVTERLRSGSLALSPRRAELKRLADASRLLTGRLVATDAPDDVVAAAAAKLEEAAALFEGFAQGSTYGFGETANVGGKADPMFDHSPLLGIANPVAPPMTITEEDGVVIGRVTYGQAYEGPPNCVHGGFVAATFDEVLGAAQSLSGAPGMTGTLKVRYESPTPLRTELRIEGRLVGVERRKIFTEGLCYAGDRLTARAEGIFISLNPGMVLDLLAERARRQEAQR
jgi:acyl-coenzyme A thioesterase PaaI-like protein